MGSVVIDGGALLENWSISFPDFEPVAHLLRSRFSDRWVRFHYLPESKRYPDTEDECRTVLDRYNAVLSDLTQTDPQLLLLTTEFARISQPSATSSCAKFWRSTRVEAGWWHIYAREMRWKLGVFDAVFRQVAGDVEFNVMITPPDCGWLFHPYDGGLDVILDSSAARDALRLRFSHWLSPLPSGL